MGMTSVEEARLARLEGIIGGFGIAKDLTKPGELTFGEPALEYAWARQWSAFLGIGLAQQSIADHIATSHAGGAADHVHTLTGTTGSRL